jgi:hypothetical protein
LLLLLMLSAGVMDATISLHHSCLRTVLDKHSGSVPCIAWKHELEKMLPTMAMCVSLWLREAVNMTGGV